MHEVMKKVDAQIGGAIRALASEGEKPIESWKNELLSEWRNEIRRWPEMDSLGSADWWIARITRIAAQSEQKGREAAVESLRACETIVRGVYRVTNGDLEVARNKTL